MEHGNLDREAIATRLEDFGDDEVLDAARQFLQNPKARPISRPLRGPAAKLLRVWSVRLQNTRLTGRKLSGAAALVERLRALHRSTAVRAYALETEEKVGLFYFTVEDNKFIGLVLTDKPDPRIALGNWEFAMGKREESSKASK